MAKITRNELLKIAQISNIQVYDDEIDVMIAQLESVLSYAERVKEIAADIEIAPPTAVNVMRYDLVESSDAQAILAQAPEHEENFFVVPKILDSNT